MKRLFADGEKLATLCERHGITRLALFGSVLRGSDHAHSDIDLLVDFESGRKPGMLGMATIESELSELLGGRRVDLRTYEELSRYFRDEVLREAEVQYAA